DVALDRHDVELAGSVLAERNRMLTGRDSEVGRDLAALGDVVAVPAERPEARRGVVAVEVPAGEARRGTAAVDEAADDRRSFAARLLERGRGADRCAAG